MTVTVSQQAQYQGPTVTSQKVFHKIFLKKPIVRRYLRRNLVILTKIKNKLRKTKDWEEIEYMKNWTFISLKCLYKTHI